MYTFQEQEKKRNTINHHYFTDSCTQVPTGTSHVFPTKQYLRGFTTRYDDFILLPIELFRQRDVA